MILTFCGCCLNFLIYHYLLVRLLKTNKPAHDNHKLFELADMRRIIFMKLYEIAKYGQLKRWLSTSQTKFIFNCLTILFMSFFTFVFWNLPQECRYCTQMKFIRAWFLSAGLCCISFLDLYWYMWDRLLRIISDVPGFQYSYMYYRCMPEYGIWNISVGIDGYLDLIMLLLTVSTIPFCACQL